MKTIIFLISILLISCSSFAQSIPEEKLYLGQIPPGKTPTIFGQGIISLANRRETKIVFSPASNECLIGIGESGTFKILYSKFENGVWSEIRPANFITNDRAQEPFFSPDGKKIFFTSHADIYFCNKEGQTWSTPIKLNAPVNTFAEEYHPTVTLDGTLYFCSMRESSNGDLYRSKLENGNYTTVEKLDKVINTPHHAWDPFIAADESYIIFTSIHPDGFGNEDQFISFNIDGKWTNPKNLGSKINSNKIEYGSYISNDNKYYFFSRPEGWGTNVPADIYWVKASFIDSLRHTNFIPYLKKQIGIQSIQIGSLFNFTLPDETFVDDDGNDTLTFSAALSDGTPLPLWLRFNSATNTFSGTPLEAGSFIIKITATDISQACISSVFEIKITK